MNTASNEYCLRRINNPMTLHLEIEHLDEAVKGLNRASDRLSKAIVIASVIIGGGLSRGGVSKAEKGKRVRISGRGKQVRSEEERSPCSFSLLRLLVRLKRTMSRNFLHSRRGYAKGAPVWERASSCAPPPSWQRGRPDAGEVGSSRPKSRQRGTQKVHR